MRDPFVLTDTMTCFSGTASRIRTCVSIRVPECRHRSTVLARPVAEGYFCRRTHLQLRVRLTRDRYDENVTQLPNNDLVHDASVFLPVCHFPIVAAGLLRQRQLLRFFRLRSRRLFVIRQPRTGTMKTEPSSDKTQ